MIQFFNKKMSKKRKGFTLIELVVVVAILGILAALAIPRLTGARSQAAENADAASIRTMQSAIGLAEAQGTLDLSAAAAPTAATIRGFIEPDYVAEIPVSQTTGSTGWDVTIGGAAGGWTVDIEVSTEATPDWAN